MNKAVKKRWIAALRSGKYKQGRKRLCSIKNGKSKYCCLGVLTDIEYDGYWYYDKLEGWHIKVPHKEGDYPESDQLVPELAEKCALSLENVEELIWMNDNERCSFKEIANWIQKNL